MSSSSRWFRTLGLALLAIFYVASSFSTTTVNAQSTALLGRKLAKFQEKATKGKGVIELDSSSFEEVLSMPRNYSIVVLFTAISPEFQCVPCKNFDPEYKLVASGWSKMKDKSQLLFGSLDFKVGQAVFQKFGMTNAPSALYFPASSAESAPAGTPPPHQRYDFGKSGFQAESFAGWLSARSGVPLAVKRPFDFVGFALKLLGVLGFGAIGHFMYNRAGKILRNKYIWAAMSLFTIFVMISGHMWNQIRNPPYTMPGRDGRPGFIAQGFQNQFGMETQIIAMIYAVLCCSVISLISSVPRIEDPSKQRFAVWVWIAIFGIMFSMLMQFFRLKNPGYPFRLLF
ncbi:oligosaccharyltransferase complex subunit gamma [Entomortierella parvispora]|uniref:Oligosaccharyltransferase complex subunit gamma n=1 Tax=Entomortierella parvispora TaxID=205924 RepID=A0A9P3HIZ0_9FUNG|nr:oligosaccharyltransferase complex subunit gamma [Entomortierella parvispora]